ncbi:T-cell surface glycoprotein CD8 alpha chain [Mastacembelus armatus]|uniref:CD8a molecule n=1 Tax=Mastacembelus armatus TaxID=205130 RepID=A0A3Q3MYR2_9TELE|nr:T-cell surface glycoprotein CD8 alpha chain-like [Mastacembelus armatus]
MNQKWIQILVILVFYQRITAEAGEKRVKDGEGAEITCNPKEQGTMVIWFRVLDHSGMEFIGSFSNSGLKKSKEIHQKFSETKMSQHILMLKSFSKAEDSGTYTCASFKDNKLNFGEITRLVGEKVKETLRSPPATPTKPNLQTTTMPCVCNTINEKVETSPDLFCTPLILGPLAGGCGLLLLLLIIITLYCNRIRTRRCPHHYKRKPRPMAPGKQMMTNRHI